MGPGEEPEQVWSCQQCLVRAGSSGEVTEGGTALPQLPGQEEVKTCKE